MSKCRLSDRVSVHQTAIGRQICTLWKHSQTWANIAFTTLLVQSFAGIKLRGDKLSRTPRAKIKSRGYKHSRMKEVLGLFSYFHAIILLSFD